MAYNYEYPYTDPNRYNSDWVLKKVAESEESLKKALELLNDINDNVDTITKEEIQRLIDSGQFQEYITDILNEFEQVKLFARSNMNMLAIGDSWGTASNNYFTYIANKLHAKQLYNYSENGAGFSRPTSFSDLATKASIEMSEEEKNNTTLVILSGGVNDLRYKTAIDYGALQNLVIGTINDIHRFFPNALIVTNLLTFPMFTNDAQNFVWSDLINRAIKQLVTIPILQIENAKYSITNCRDCWLYEAGYTDVYGYLHPSPKGHSILASQIVKTMLGGGDEVDFTYEYVTNFPTKAEENPYNKIALCKRNGSIYSSGISFTILQATTANTNYQIGELWNTSGFCPRTHQVVPAINASNGMPIGNLILTNLGDLYLNTRIGVAENTVIATSGFNYKAVTQELPNPNRG